MTAKSERLRCRQQTASTMLLYCFVVYCGLTDAILPDLFKYISPPSLRGCGNSTFNPSKQSCCQDTVNDVREAEAQCCGNLAYRRNSNKPANCTRPCGKGTFHPDTERCCGNRAVWMGRDDRIICCGDTTVHPRTHVCCGHFPYPRDAGYDCCGKPYVASAVPYITESMKCDPASRQPILRKTQLFSVQHLCERGLFTWNAAAPLPIARHHYVMGWAQRCDTNITQSISGWKLHIRLTPFFLTGTDVDPQCADSSSFAIVVKLPRQTCDVNRQELQAYLHGEKLILFFWKRIKCMRGIPTLRLKENNNAVLLISTRSSYRHGSIDLE